MRCGSEVEGFTIFIRIEDSVLDGGNMRMNDTQHISASEKERHCRS